MRVKQTISQYRGETIFTVSNIVTSIVSLLSAVIAAAFVEPEDLGAIQAVFLVSTYVSFLHLGVFNGLNRNLAFYKAKGELEKAQKEVDTSHTVSLIVAAIGFIVGSVVLGINTAKGMSGAYIWGSVFLIFSLVLQPLTNHIECTYRSGQEFERLGKQKIWQAVVFFVVSFLPAILGYVGRVIAQIVNLIVGYVQKIFKQPYKSRSWGDKESLKDLISTGAPLLISGCIWSIFVVADKTYIATSLSSRDLGLYTISGYCITLMMVIPGALNTLLYPKAATRYGQTGDKTSLQGFWKKSLLVFSFVLFPLCFIAYFALPYVVEWLMPKYIEGIPAARISLLTCATFISMGPSVIFGTLKKNIGNIIAITCCLGLFWLIVSIWGESFCTIERVALLRFGLSFILMIFHIVYSYLLIRK